MTAPLFGAPDSAPPTNPWTLARAIWPGAFAEPWQDEQIDAGRGDWPLVLTCWRPRGSYQVLLRALELPPSLRWRYVEPWGTVHRPTAPVLRATGNARRRAEEAYRQARELGHRWYAPTLQACALGVELPDIRDVLTGQRHRPDVGALARLATESVIPMPPPQSRGGAMIRKWQGREQRIAEKYPDGLPLFGGAA